MVAMQFTKEVNWSLFDFILMGGLMFGAALAYELITKQANTPTFKTAVAIALATAFLLVWINGAVGIIGSENNPANLLYFGVLAVGFIGTIIARLKPRKMSFVLFATALTQALVPVIALTIWQPAFSPGVIAVFVLNAFFVLLFIVSGLLFKHAADQH
ncbi:MAG: hypothetical protein HUU49_01360 [Candidatus Buchananbacteria bacterium]|nr:hypothetical protein [Candidatus Buchananbacteria bacterium]